MNPLHSHWIRVSLALVALSPVVALLVAVTAGAGFRLSLAITLYISFLVCGILALMALVALAMRLVGRGVRVFRR